jgi:SIT4-associating protein SAP185/190
MFWRFGFASTSTLDTLLEKPNLTIEELLDEDDLLQECKAQNGKLVDFLSQPRTIKRLFEHVVGIAEVSGPGGKEWEEKVRFKYPYVASEVLSSEIYGIVETALANPEELLDPFWTAVLHASPGHVQPPFPHHSHPLLAGSPSASPIPPGKSLPIDEEREKARVASNEAAAESSKDGTTKVVRATDNGPGKSVLAGYWAKVNGVFLDKKPREMLTYIQGLPRIVERFVAHLETPAAVDLLYRIISCEQTMPGAGVVEWLSDQELIPKIVDLLSPSHSVDLHNTISELLKAIIALSAPSPAGMGPGQDTFGGGNAGGQEQAIGVQNRLVRELASEPMIRKMVSFMLDSVHPFQLTRRLSQAAEDAAEQGDQEDDAGLSFGGSRKRKPSTASKSAIGLSTLSEDSALDDEDAEETDPQPLNPSLTPAFAPRSPAHRDSTATVRPATVFPPVSAPECQVTPETSSSSLITGIGIFIELIRKNNSDYFEQHLFHALRSHLLQRQQEIADQKAEATGGAAAADASRDEDDEEMEGMEEAMAEMTDKLGIVHLGPMLTVLCERLSEFQDLINRPNREEDQIVTTLGKVDPLSFERYRITELYAELLHCSNMALLNRAAGEGPQYSTDGLLQGGIQGLQTLARTLQGGDADDSIEDAPNEEPSIPTLGSSSEEDSKDTSASPSGRHTRQRPSAGGEASEGSRSVSTANEGSPSLQPSSDAAAENPFGDDDEQVTTSAGSGPATTEQSEEAPKADDESIRSVLSSMSLADLTSPSDPTSPATGESNESYVVGDLLKKKFLDCDIIPTILRLFFEYPWNNFLHNVVYDILQQCFNGRMDAGLNRKLTLAVFEKGELPKKILAGQQRNVESMKDARRIRLGFMGHMNLIAEETVKLLERYPQEIAEVVGAESIPHPEWDNFVNQSLRENREKEAAPLAGGRPTQHSFGTMSNDDEGGLGTTGRTSGDSGDNGAFANYLSSQMGGGEHSTSDDDDSDEESSWMAQDSTLRQRGGPSGTTGFDDVFEPSTATGEVTTATTTHDEDDDQWGPFSASSSTSTAGAMPTPFDFKSSASGPLTSADWATAAFNRSGSPEDVIFGSTGTSQDDSSSAVVDDDDEDSGATPFVDLADASTYRQRQQRRLSQAGRRPSAGSTDLSAAQAIDPTLATEQPLGPGVAKDAEVKDGMVTRTLDDGRTVTAPLDDVALAQQAESEAE